MQGQLGRQPSRAHERPAQLERLEPAGAPAPVAEVIEQWGLWQRPAGAGERPRVLLNMVCSLDGRATIGGRSAPLSAAADRELFHGLRSAVDAVLVGAGTVRTEHYGRIVADPEVRRLRRARGLSEEPLACIVSGHMALDARAGLLAEPSARVVVLSASSASLPATAAHVDYVRTTRAGVLDLAGAMRELRARFNVEMLLCEGGPHLATQLFAEALIDELFLTVSPKLAGGEPSGEEALGILAGSELEAPVELELLGAMRSSSQLFLRYRVVVA